MNVIFSTSRSSPQDVIDEFVHQAVTLQQDLEEQISKIKRELEELNRSFQAGRYDDGLAMRDIRDVGYRFENLLEALIIHTGYSPGRQSSKCILKGFCKAWSTKNKFVTINYEIEGMKSPYNRPRDSNHIERNDQFVGRVEEMERLLVYLCSDREINDQVISISGMAGIGKTALAWKLFKHPEVVSYYDTYRAWVNVSRNFEKRKILEMILEELRKQGCIEDQPSSVDKMDDRTLVSTIQIYLKAKNTLIVLDGICSVNDWESLSAVLPKTNNNGDCRSNILITTRINEVAESSAPHRNRGSARWFHLPRLTESEGSQLLGNNVPGLVNQLRGDLGKKIVNFCGGVPSTITAFFKSMNAKHTLEAWEEMATILERNSNSSKRLEPQELQKALGVLASARHTLQPFFLYMGVLQEDLRVEIEKFYLVSMADGTLRPLRRGGGKILDIEQSYVTEAAQRNLVDLEEGEEPTITRFKYCHLNEFMRDLSLWMNKDEGFFTVVDFAHGSQVVTDLSSSRSRSRRIFHVAINLDENEDGYDFPIEKVDMMHVRVLLFSAKKIRFWPEELSGLLILKFLRVLDFNRFNFKPTGLPKGIERAVHLRYLSFRDCILPELPTSIANLPFLCVLDLRVQCSTKMIIPNVLWKMKKLKHLYFPLSFRTDDAGKLRLDGLTELETITNFNVARFNVKDLFGMPKLQYLDSHVVEKVKDIECIIEHIIERMRMHSDADSLRTSVKIGKFDCYTEERVSIQKFDCYTEERESIFRKLLECPSLVALSIQGYIRTLLYNEISQNLIKIVLTGSEMMEDPMKTLAKLPKLRVLVLDNAFGGKEIVCSAPGFVELKVLKILDLKFLEKWTVKDGAMPKLSTLAIANCEKLREVKVSRMPEEFIRRVQMLQGTFQVIIEDQSLA